MRSRFLSGVMEIAGFGSFECQFLVIGERWGVVAGEVGRWFWSDNGDLAKGMVATMRSKGGASPSPTGI